MKPSPIPTRPVALDEAAKSHPHVVALIQGISNAIPKIAPEASAADIITAFFNVLANQSVLTEVIASLENNTPFDADAVATRGDLMAGALSKCIASAARLEANSGLIQKQLRLTLAPVGGNA